MNGLSIAFRETKCVNIRIDLTRDIPLTILGKYHNLSKKDRRMDLREIIYAEDFPPLADIFSEIVSGRQKALNAHCRINIGEDYHWVYLSCSVRKDTFNRTQHLTGTMMDVSDYLDADENDYVLDGAAKKNRERIDAAINSQDGTLIDILGEDYLLRIQQALTVNNGVSSAFYDEKGELLLSPADEKGRIISQKKFKHSISEVIRCNHKLMAVWRIASDDTDELEKTAPLLNVLSETVSQIANAIFVLYNEMENSKAANQQLGSNIEQQILLNNIYNIILENNNAVEALKMVIRLVGEYMKLDRIALYDYNSETSYAKLNTDWSANGIEMKYEFSLNDFPQLVDELNYCDTFFSGSNFTEMQKMGVRSFVVSQLAENGKFTGLIFYETIRKERIWSNSDKKMLRNISQIVSTMLIRCNMDSAIKTQNRRLKLLAFTDPVLNIPNRACLDRDLSEKLRSGGSGVLISLKLVNVNTVNEAFGHIYSDAILEKISQYIDGISFEGKQVYRFSGSVLMILIDNCTREKASGFLDGLMERFSQPWTVAEEAHYLETNAGGTFFPRDADTTAEVYRRSTLALYRAAGEDKNTYAFYLSGNEEKAGVAFNAEQQLRRAVFNNMENFSVKYLPITDTDGKISALEAGVCWEEPANGSASASNIIRLAESIGVDEIIDSWVIDNSCRFLREVIDLSGREELMIHINLTSHELQRSAVHKTIITAIEKYGLKGTNLAVEVPEKAQLKIGSDISAVLEGLRNIGVKVVIDDYGSEYMSLSVLKSEAVSKIKIRAERFLNNDEFDRIALNNVLQLAHTKNIEVCVKHIENREQLEAASKYDIDLLQGDFLIPPTDGETAKGLFASVELSAVISKINI